MTQQETILNKIKKLLALADIENNSTPEEAATAAAKVQELLQKYNLDQSMIQKDSPKHRMRVCEVGLPTTRLWAKNLLWTLAYYNFCKAIWYVHSPRAFLLGEETNIEAVLALYGHLGTTLTTMASTHYAAYVKNCRAVRKHPVAGQTYKANFYEGAIAAISYRLNKQQQEFVNNNVQTTMMNGQEVTTSKALIVVNTQELEDFQAERFPEVEHRKTTYRDVDGAGYRTGIKAGMEVELNKLVAEGK